MTKKSPRRRRPPPKIKAYLVRRDDHAEVVFARNPMEARRLGAGTLGCGEDEIEDYDRDARFDGYETASLEALRRWQLELGWHFECGHCYKLVYGDEDAPHTYVIRDAVVYCSSQCCIARLRKEQAEREWTWKALEHVTTVAPGAELARIYKNVEGDAIVEMRRPGDEFFTTDRFRLDG